MALLIMPKVRAAPPSSPRTRQLKYCRKVPPTKLLMLQTKDSMLKMVADVVEEAPWARSHSENNTP